MLNQLPRILVIDDNPVNCEICKEILQEDYHIKIAECGESGLKAVQEFEPDLVLLDVMMPGIDGYEVCRRIRKSTRSWVKIIMVSAKVQPEDRIAGYKAGADDYVTKPFEEGELIAKIRVHLRLKHVEEIDAIKCQLLQVLQHGNRTSMTHIMTNADILASMHEKLSDDERLARVNAVQRGASRLHYWLATGEQLVALMTGQYDFSPAGIDVAKRVTKVYKYVEKREAVAKGRVQLHVEPGLQLQCDREFFDLLIDRLICDALGSTKEETSILLHIEASQLDRVRIRINRSCENPQADMLTKLFEPFGVPEEVLHNMGDGMSLPIVKEIARIHGGLVRAVNVDATTVEIQAELPTTQDVPRAKALGVETEPKKSCNE